MLKKIVVATLLVGLIGLLVGGAIIRTMDKTGSVAEAQGRGYGQGSRTETDSAVSSTQGRGGYGQGRAGDDVSGRQYSNYETLPEGWLEYEGSVIQVPDDGNELVIQTGDGEQVTVGTGPLDMASQGFALETGEQVQVRGYWEDGEFKAGQVTRLANGQTLTLRDELGRPTWAGAGRNAQGNGQGREDAPGDQTGSGAAQVEEWLTFQGFVVGVDADTLVVQTTGGGQVVVENRAWWFAQDQGFSAQVGDEVVLLGFYEGDDVEVGQIEDLDTGQVVRLRDESGRPLWAGQGRGAGRGRSS